MGKGSSAVGGRGNSGLRGVTVNEGREGWERRLRWREEGREEGEEVDCGFGFGVEGGCGDWTWLTGLRKHRSLELALTAIALFLGSRQEAEESKAVVEGIG